LAVAAGASINETILYSFAFSALFLVFVLALAGESSFIGSILFEMVQNENPLAQCERV
jgi:hypothetical protein